MQSVVYSTRLWEYGTPSERQGTILSIHPCVEKQENVFGSIYITVPRSTTNTVVTVQYLVNHVARYNHLLPPLPVLFHLTDEALLLKQLLHVHEDLNSSTFLNITFGRSANRFRISLSGPEHLLLIPHPLLLQFPNPTTTNLSRGAIMSQTFSIVFCLPT